jgi:hypothetical protein
MQQHEFTLADLTRITGAKRRTVQLWAEAGVILARADTERGGSGTHRRFSRDEAIVACVLRPFAERQMSIGEVLNVATAVRRQLQEGGHAREILENAIQGRWHNYLMMTTLAPGEWACTVLDTRGTTPEEWKERWTYLGASVEGMFDHMDAKKRAGAMMIMIYLNTLLAPLR